MLFFQSLLIGAQIINGGLASVNHGPNAPVVALIVGACVGSLQFFVQHLGNQMTPPPSTK